MRKSSTSIDYSSKSSKKRRRPWAAIGLMTLAAYTCRGVKAEHLVDHSLVFYSATDVGGSGALAIRSADGALEVLPSASTDRRYFGIAADDKYLYWATDRTIERATFTGTERVTLVGGWVTVNVVGYYLGDRASDVLEFSVKGVKCTTFSYQSASSLTCIYNDASLTADDVIISENDISITTTIGKTVGGWAGDFVQARLSEHILLPIITGVQVEVRELTPYAVSVDTKNKVVYWSNHAQKNIERCNIDGSNMEVYTQNAGTVYGLAIDTANNFMYYTDTRKNTVKRVPLLALGKSPTLSFEELLISDINTPMGIALDVSADLMYVAHRGGAISVASMTGANIESNKLKFPLYHKVVVQRGVQTRIDGVAVIKGILHWTEGGASSQIARAHQTGVQLEVLASDTQGGILWPRALVASSDGLQIYFTEYLGTVKVLPLDVNGTPNAGGIVTVAEENYYFAAYEIRRRVQELWKAGVFGIYFLGDSH